MRRYTIVLRSGREVEVYAERLNTFYVQRSTGRVAGLTWIDGDSGFRLYHVVPSEIAAVVEQDLPASYVYPRAAQGLAPSADPLQPEEGDPNGPPPVDPPPPPVGMPDGYFEGDVDVASPRSTTPEDGGDDPDFYYG